MKQNVLYGALFCLWLVTVSVLSFIPKFSITYIKIDEFQFRIDYPIHIFAYIPGGILLLLWSNEKKTNPEIKLIIISLVCCLVFASMTEILQKFIPGRTFNYFDLIFNYTGIISGIILFYLYKKLFYR